mgnify:CR=1 FL=1
MNFNKYDIGTLCLGGILGFVVTSDIPIIRKVIMSGLIIIVSIQFIILKYYKLNNEKKNKRQAEDRRV